MSVVIKIENVSKQYRLGLIGTNTLKGDLQRWWKLIKGESIKAKVNSRIKNMNENELQERLFRFAIDVIKMLRNLKGSSGLLNKLRDIQEEVQIMNILSILKASINFSKFVA